MVSPITDAAPTGAGRLHDRGLDAPNATAAVAVVTPTDRVRWGPVFAGLFAALSTLALLGVLGVAVAGSAYDPGDQARSLGVGAGVWAAASALVAFFVGGLVSARTAAVRGTGSGVFQGAMVWLVAIPLLMYGAASLVGAAARSAGMATAGAAQTAAAAAQTPQGQQAAGQAQSQLPTADQLKQQGQQAVGQVQQAVTDPQNRERAADATAKGAWGTLLSMVLGLAAAAAGGWSGARGIEHVRGRLGARRSVAATA